MNKFFLPRWGWLACLLLLAACSKPQTAPATDASQASTSAASQVTAPAAPQPVATAQSGEHFVRLPNQLPTQSGEKIEVDEFFNYGCPHCSELDPILNQWLASLPPDVVFRRIPLPLRQAWEPYARMFYAEQDMGLNGKLHSKIFHAIHEENIDLSDPAQLRPWLTKQGVDANRFMNILNSFSVKAKEQEGENLAEREAIHAVPTLVVDGRYKTDVGLAGGYQQVPAVLNDLIARTRQDHSNTH